MPRLLIVSVFAGGLFLRSFVLFLLFIFTDFFQLDGVFLDFHGLGELGFGHRCCDNGVDGLSCVNFFESV